jgi:hypothetical protein
MDSSEQAVKRGQQETRDQQELEKHYKDCVIGNNYPYAFEVYRGFNIHLMSVHYYTRAANGEFAGRLLRDEYVVRGGRIADYKNRFRTKEQAKSFIDALPDATPA